MTIIMNSGKRVSHRLQLYELYIYFHKITFAILGNVFEHKATRIIISKGPTQQVIMQ